MKTIYKVEYYCASDTHTSGGYTAVERFDNRAQAGDFAQRQTELSPGMPANIYEECLKEPGDPEPEFFHCEHCDFKTKDKTELVEEPYNLACQDCHDNCEHDWDAGEGGMCMSCGRDDYYNFIDEDYGQDR